MKLDKWLDEGPQGFFTSERLAKASEFPGPDDSQADGFKDGDPYHKYRTWKIRDAHVLAIRAVVDYLYADEYTHALCDVDTCEDKHIFDSVDVLHEWLRNNAEDV